MEVLSVFRSKVYTQRLYSPYSVTDLSIICNQIITVPINWTVQKDLHANCCRVYDHDRYTNVQIPFQIFYQFISEFNPMGNYLLQFSILPFRWVKNELNQAQMQRTVILHLARVEACFIVKGNVTLWAWAVRILGYHVSLRLPPASTTMLERRTNVLF